GVCAASSRRRSQSPGSQSSFHAKIPKARGQFGSQEIAVLGIESCFYFLAFALRYAELRCFAAKLSQAVENDRESLCAPGMAKSFWEEALFFRQFWTLPD